MGRRLGDLMERMESGAYSGGCEGADERRVRKWGAGKFLGKGDKCCG
jgi:hypothetical protein